MDVIDLLIADHNRMRGLIARYHSAENKAASDLASSIIHELNVHMAVEENIFYQPVKGRTEEIAGDVDEGFEEHHVAKVLIGEIEGLEPGDDIWIAKMTVLIESVEHHIDEEETELFPSVRTATPADWRGELGQRLEAEKAALGATPLADKLCLSTTELRAKAREQEIPGRSSMGHDELAATVNI
jgi:hemerythrin-like domain-containing protein